MTLEELADEELVRERTKSVPCCSDFDEDCEDVPDKVHCYLYDPVRGYCPYLRSHAQMKGGR